MICFQEQIARAVIRISRSPRAQDDLAEMYLPPTRPAVSPNSVSSPSLGGNRNGPVCGGDQHLWKRHRVQPGDWPDRVPPPDGGRPSRPPAAAADGNRAKHSASLSRL